MDFSVDLQKEITDKLDITVEFVNHNGIKTGKLTKDKSLHEFYLPIALSL